MVTPVQHSYMCYQQPYDPSTRYTEQQHTFCYTMQRSIPPTATVSSDTDTIAAIITGAYQGTVSIIRLSGPDALPIALTVFRRGKPPSQSHSAFFSMFT